MTATLPPAKLSSAAAPAWAIAAGAATLIVLQALILHHMGQPLIAASGRILLWVGNPFSPETSQQLSDWYSFSHIIHGFIFYGLLRLAAPRQPVGARLLIAMAIEICWEITENSPAVIQHYREQALAVVLHDVVLRDGPIRDPTITHTVRHITVSII